MTERVLQLGVIGLGRFAQFSLPHFLKVSGLKLRAVSNDHLTEIPRTLTEIQSEIDLMDAEDLLNCDGIDIVYIANPPFLHYSYSKKALLKGKHVICEKPISFTLKEAKELEQLATEKDLLLIVNQMQRYNPIICFLKQIISSGALGTLVYASLENHASTSGLPSGHWFWDRKKSGGIFLEHGVHFFDIFDYFLGAGRLISAERLTDLASGLERRVRSSTVYSEGTLVDIYHGFTQQAQEKQVWNFAWENGFIELSGWIPQHLALRALVRPSNFEIIKQVLQKLVLPEEVKKAFRNKVSHTEPEYRGLIDVRIDLECTITKEELYGNLLTLMVRDQLQWLRDKQHTRILTACDAVEAVKIAEQVTKNAITITG